MSVHRWRRFALLWTPIYVAGIALMAASAFLTTSWNGLTLTGALIALAGLMAAAKDTKETR